MSLNIADTFAVLCRLLIFRLYILFFHCSSLFISYLLSKHDYPVSRCPLLFPDAHFPSYYETLSLFLPVNISSTSSLAITMETHSKVIDDKELSKPLTFLTATSCVCRYAQPLIASGASVHNTHSTVKTVSIYTVMHI